MYVCLDFWRTDASLWSVSSLNLQFFLSLLLKRPTIGITIKIEFEGGTDTFLYMRLA